MKTLLFLGLWASICLQAAPLQLPEGCSYNKECLMELPLSVCADGTQSFFTVTVRENTNNLLIYLSGGGACWNEETCRKGYAKPLTRVAPENDWVGGDGIRNASDSENPLGREYSVVTVPYCTGDVYAGNRTVNYGSSTSPYEIRHQGYRNIQLTLDAVKVLFPNPEKAVCLGESAGGIGVYYHLENFAKTFPLSRRYVVSDAGLPFKPPFLLADRYKMVMDHWGVEATLPKEAILGRKVDHFGDVIEYNRLKFPDVKFAFISSYRDFVMSYFGYLVGAASPTTMVQETMIDVANNHVGTDSPNAKVFYIDDSKHTHMDRVSETESQGLKLSKWMREMLSDSAIWVNIRPDLKG